MGLFDIFHNNKKRDNIRDTLQERLHDNGTLQSGSNGGEPSDPQPSKLTRRKSLAMFLKKRHTINFRVSSRGSSELCKQDGVMEEIRRKVAEHDAIAGEETNSDTAVSPTSMSPLAQQQQQQQPQSQPIAVQSQQGSPSDSSKRPSNSSSSHSVPPLRLSNSLPSSSNHLGNVIGSLGIELEEEDQSERPNSAPSSPRPNSNVASSPITPTNTFQFHSIANPIPATANHLQQQQLSSSSSPNVGLENASPTSSNMEQARKKMTNRRASIDLNAIFAGIKGTFSKDKDRDDAVVFTQSSPSNGTASGSTSTSATSSSVAGPSGVGASSPLQQSPQPTQLHITKSAIPFESEINRAHAETNGQVPTSDPTTPLTKAVPVQNTPATLTVATSSSSSSSSSTNVAASSTSSTNPNAPGSENQKTAPRSGNSQMGFRYNNVVSSGRRMHRQYFVKPSFSSASLGSSSSSEAQQSPGTSASGASRDSRRFSGMVPLPTEDILGDEDNIMLNTEDPKVQIILACSAGDIEKTKELLEKDPTLVQSLDPFDRSTPLHKAAGRNDIPLAVLLLDKGANVNAVDILDALPIHWAAASQSADIVAVLVSRGSKVNVRDKYGYAPLHLSFRMRNEFAAAATTSHAKHIPLSAEEISAENERKQKRFRVVEELLFFGADINFKKEDGTTAMHMCCERNDTDAVEFLMQHKAILNVRDRWGETPLISAASNNAVKVVATILRGLDSTPELMKTVIQARDDNGYSVLHRCAQTGNNDLLKLIVVKMTPELSSKIVNNPDVRTQSTPLHIAVAKNYPKVVRALLFIGADVNAQDLDGDTPLHVACRSKNEELIRMLLLATAPTNPEKRLCRLDIRNKRKETAKQVAKRQEINLKQLIMKSEAVPLI